MIKDFAIYLDLDGVLADYSAGIESFGFKVDRAVKLDLNRSGSGHPLKREMYEAVKGTAFYLDLPMMPGAIDLYDAAVDADPIILTAAPKFGATEDDYFVNPFWLGAAYNKRRWIEDRFLPATEKFDGTVDVTIPWSTMDCITGPPRVTIPDDRFICTTSARKWQFMHRKRSDHQILIDDRIDNINAWANNGGVGILHVDAATSIKALEAYTTNVNEVENLFADGWTESQHDNGIVYDPRVGDGQ